MQESHDGREEGPGDEGGDKDHPEVPEVGQPAKEASSLHVSAAYTPGDDVTDATEEAFFLHEEEVLAKILWVLTLLPNEGYSRALRHGADLA